MVERHASLLIIETLITIIMIIITMFDHVHDMWMMLKISHFVLGPSGIHKLALAGNSEPMSSIGHHLP